MRIRDKGTAIWSWCFVAALVTGIWLSGCDEPPTTPEPSIDIDEKQQELRQKVEETQAEAKTRVDNVAEQIPDDAGSPDTSSEQPAPPEQ